MLAPLDCAFLDGRDGTGRVAVVCRATERCLPEDADAWMTGASFGFDYRDLLRRYRIDDAKTADCHYERAVDPRLLRPGTDTIDLWRSVTSGVSHAIAADDLVLRLNDRD